MMLIMSVKSINIYSSGCMMKISAVNFFFIQGFIDLTN